MVETGHVEAIINFYILFIKFYKFYVTATSEEEAKKFIEAKERHQHEYGPGITVLDKVCLGNIENKIMNVKEVWEEK